MVQCTNYGHSGGICLWNFCLAHLERRRVATIGYKAGSARIGHQVRYWHKADIMQLSTLGYERAV